MYRVIRVMPIIVENTFLLFIISFELLCFKFCLRELWWLQSRFSLSVVYTYYVVRVCTCLHYLWLMWQVQWHISSALLPSIFVHIQQQSARKKFFLGISWRNSYLWNVFVSLKIEVWHPSYHCEETTGT